MEECSICLTDFDNSAKKLLDCGHVYHPTCIELWVEQTLQCPYCKRIILDVHLIQKATPLLNDEQMLKTQIICQFFMVLISRYEDVIETPILPPEVHRKIASFDRFLQQQNSQLEPKDLFRIFFWKMGGNPFLLEDVYDVIDTACRIGLPLSMRDFQRVEIYKLCLYIYQFASGKDRLVQIFIKLTMERLYELLNFIRKK